MAIADSDIILRLTTKSGSAGDTTAQANPNLSLGKYASTSAWVAGTNSLFDNISGDENAASTVDYRAVAVLNNHATLTLENAFVYVSAEVSGGAAVAIAVDNIGPTAKGSSSAQAAEIATETTAPTGVGAFSTPTNKAGALPLGNIGPGQVKMVWVRRTASNSAAKNNDGFTLVVGGDTAE